MQKRTQELLQEPGNRFKVFHELMSRKIQEILLVSTPYDAWIMEEDTPLSERIINEYRGLNLSSPPRLTWASRAEEALRRLQEQHFDMVITMPNLADMDAFDLGREIKSGQPELPVMLFSHGRIPSRECYIDPNDRPEGIDRIFSWNGNTDLLLASIKCAEDRMNAAMDTARAGIRVILFVEDSPDYLSSVLPILYKELVSQTQAVMEHGLNEEHRLLTMRARPKVLVAEDFEEALDLYRRFEPYIMGVISDLRFPKQCRMNDEAGVELLSRIQQEHFDIPLALMSSESGTSALAGRLAADFVDKNGTDLHERIRTFLKNRLGFGDFVFRMPDGTPVGSASNLRALERWLASVPRESFTHHCNRNDFSRWLFARTEIELADMFRPLRGEDFWDVESHRQYLVSSIRSRRKLRQKGVVVDFDAEDFDPDTEFMKIGAGSLGGKARGLAFMASLLASRYGLQEEEAGMWIIVPQTLVVTTEGFESFVDSGGLRELATTDLPDDQVAERFLQTGMPEWITEHLRGFLREVDSPLAVRSSSLLEDARFTAYAGLYRTYMIPNTCPDLETRLEQLVTAVKLVFASTYFRAPKTFSRRVGHRTEEEQMAVLIQRVVGRQHGEYFYPDISGVAQSYNYYPFAGTRPEEGIAAIALGMGRTVMEGEQVLRFCPERPNILPQRTNMRDVLQQSQRYFYALRIESECTRLEAGETGNLTRREVLEARNESPVRRLASTYLPAENRIRDRYDSRGHPVLTFAPVLKHRRHPLPRILREGLRIGEQGLGAPVEMEFAADLEAGPDGIPTFSFLQMRPMSARSEMVPVEIEAWEIEAGLCFSASALGNGIRQDIADIVYVKPRDFEPSETKAAASEIGRFNAELTKEGRSYLLIGPGRWGSADRWLGIPVGWEDISSVGAMVETTYELLHADPSQGSHFFHNIVGMGISFLMIPQEGKGFVDWERLLAMPVAAETPQVARIRLQAPLTVKVDGRSSQGVVLPGRS
jgi:CheY-like chemotaxis protein